MGFAALNPSYTIADAERVLPDIRAGRANGGSWP